MKVKPKTYRGQLRRNIGKIKATIERIEALPPALSPKWKEGQLRYWRKNLLAMETHYAETEAASKLRKR